MGLWWVAGFIVGWWAMGFLGVGKIVTNAASGGEFNKLLSKYGAKTARRFNY